MASSNCLVQHSSKYILCSTEEIHLCRFGIIWVKGFVLHLALDLQLNYYSSSPSELYHSTSGEHGLYQGYSTKMYRGPVRENFLKQRSGKS